MGGMRDFEVFGLEVVFDRFAERLLQDFRERATLHAMGVQYFDRDPPGAADSDFDL